MYRNAFGSLAIIAMAATVSACTSLLGDFDNKETSTNGTGGHTSTATGTGGTGNSVSTGGGGNTTTTTTTSGPTYAIGGTLTGLADGATVVLQDNGGDDLSLTQTGAFAFSSQLASGASYAVTISAQPATPSQTCVVTNGTGTVANVDVTTVDVGCTTNSFHVGGTLSGLAAGDQVVLRNNGGDDLTVAANGSFAFPSTVLSGQPYAVTVFASPTSPVSQTCTVTAGTGTGTVGAVDVTSIAVVCSTESFTVGGKVAGLTSGNSVVLQNKATDDITVSTNGDFTFPTALTSGTSYAVTVLTQPNAPPEDCQIAGGTGSVGSTNVTSVTVTCTVLGACVGKSAGFVCRPSAGQCDVEEKCDGTSPNCPPDTFVASTTTCRASAGICDVAEHCTGSSAACPADSFQPATQICNPIAGACDMAEYCTGSSSTCPPDAFLPASTTCRAAVSNCDVAETCTGSSPICPPDLFQPSGTTCRTSMGPCDPQETCTGTSSTCPADVLSPSGTVCRGPAGTCDVAETCTGGSAACPSDAFATSGTVCRAAVPGGCDVAETCNGSAATCPADVVQPSGTVCRAAVPGGCDVAETCNGSSNTCPADVVQPSGTVCRAAVPGGCDVAETCNGSSNTCPADVVKVAGTVCHASTGACDPAETCNGILATCPADALAPAGAVCRAAAGPCDVAETCSGISNTCPVDKLATAGTVCRGAADVCDVLEACDGTSSACPTNVFAAYGTPCYSDSPPCGGTCYDYGCDGGGACSVVISSYASCPMLYTWDGKDFSFESDMYPSGLLGLKLGNGYRKPDPFDTYVLAQPLTEKDGKLDLRIVEELDEMDYLDQARLFVADVPLDRDIVSWFVKPAGYVAPDQRVVTIDHQRLPIVSATDLSTSADVTATLAASDNDVLVLSDDANAPTWHSIVVDFGDLSSASIIKLIVDARSRFPYTPAGKQWQVTHNPTGVSTKIEVIDATGAWVEVPKAIAQLQKPKEFPRPMAVDITHAFLTSDYRVRLSWFYKTQLDAVWVDTTPNLPFTVVEAPLLSAGLGYHGWSEQTAGDSPIYFYAQPRQDPGWPLAPGNYTRYGDVAALLGLTDDKFVIFGTGDELQFSFAALPPPASGTHRHYIFQSSGYYKENIANPEVPYAVDPLPFLAMSNFPYDPTVEQYPTDADHQDYLATWNTRIAP